MYLIILTALAVLANSPVSAAGKRELSVEIPRYYKIRSMSLWYIEYGRQKITNDFRMFGIVKEAVENTWKSRKAHIEIANGLTFNSNKSTTGDLESNQVDVGITIQTRRRSGKLIYVLKWECSAAGRSTESIDFDLIKPTRLYSEIERLAIRHAKSCPE